MRNAIRKYRTPFLALVGIMILGLSVGGYILSNQRFYLPNWVPVIGTDFVDYKAEFATAQAVTPGQGQTVNIAGVPVGEITSVNLVDGRAVVGMKIRRKYTPIYKNASALLRPKSGLNDMLVELDPGTSSAGELDPDTAVPAGQTASNVNLDEILSSVDTDTRNYLRLLIAGGGEGLAGQGKNLSAALRRFAPINRDVLKINEQLAVRRKLISRSITNFSQLMQAVGSKDTQLAQLVEASNTTLKAFANQDQRIQEALRELPSTLEETNTALKKATTLADTLQPAARDLRPGARALASTQRKLRPFLKDSTPILRDRVRPVTREILPITKTLRPTARNLADAAPDLTSSFKGLNTLVNLLAYNPKGSEEGYGYYLAWVNHIGPQIFAGQDANGALRRGALLIDCQNLNTAETAMKADPLVYAILGLANPVSVATASAGDPACVRFQNQPPGLLGR
jgi:phospholipid/cholesterol/gamma-HCH transport system substrate-binding protein